MAICKQFVRCGKPSCRCAQGHLHGPYYYEFSRKGERLVKRYVKKADVEAAQKAYTELKQFHRMTAKERARQAAKERRYAKMSLLDRLLRLRMKLEGYVANKIGTEEG